MTEQVTAERIAKIHQLIDQHAYCDCYDSRQHEPGCPQPAFRDLLLALDTAQAERDALLHAREVLTAAGGEVVRQLRAAEQRHEACPCLHTTPCDERCTCVEPTSSRGCRRCCTYGSKEQQTKMAEYLIAAEQREVALREMLTREEYLVGAARSVLSNYENEDGVIPYAKVIDDMRFLAIAASSEPPATGEK